MTGGTVRVFYNLSTGSKIYRRQEAIEVLAGRNDSDSSKPLEGFGVGKTLRPSIPDGESRLASGFRGQ